jgi:hypothetical protein
VKTADCKDDEQEFDLLMAKCGVAVPPDRRDGSLAVFRELKRMAALLRQPRDAASEPANIFCLHAILRDE